MPDGGGELRVLVVRFSREMVGRVDLSGGDGGKWEEEEEEVGGDGGG